MPEDVLSRGRLVDMHGRTLVVMRGLLLPVSAVYYCLLGVDEVCIIWLLALPLTPGCYLCLFVWLLPLPLYLAVAFASLFGC